MSPISCAGRCGLRRLGVAFASVLLASWPVRAQDARDTTVKWAEIAPGFYVVSDAAANMVVMIGEQATFVAGLQSPSLVAGTRRLLDAIQAPPVRYALALDGDSAEAYGDGGWGAAGAVTLAHEMLNYRMQRRLRTSGSAAFHPTLDAALPVMGFSEVVQIQLSDEEVHIVHRRRGFSDSDVVLHFEKAGITHLGRSFTMDGYPDIDISQPGGLDGMIRTVEFFLDTFGEEPERIEPIIPARGPVATTEDLRAFREMLVTIRERVEALRAAGKTVEDVVGARPTADFDTRWGNGPVTPDRFVELVYRALAQTETQT